MKLLFIIYFLFTTFISYADDYSYEIPEIETGKENLKLSGNLDIIYSVFHSRKNSVLYSLQFYNQNLSDILSSFSPRLYLNGDYQTRDTGVHLKTYLEYYNEKQINGNIFELYGSINISDNLFLSAGKIMHKWGTGYAFNPVGYINPKKEPDNPELLQAGVLCAGFEYQKSFQMNFIKNLSFNIIALPPTETINNRIYEIKNTEIAGKFYILLLDTDIDIMGYYSRINPEKIGFDFSRNIIPSLEIHGEGSYFREYLKNTIYNNSLISENYSGYSYLFGLRWLNEWNITTILEYYHNDAGLSKDEFKEYNNFLMNSILSGNILNAININKSYFSGTDLMRDYLYFKISCAEPFRIVYFTFSIYGIYNIDDKSYIAGIPLSYKPVTNFEFLFWPAIIKGSINSEFGSKIYKEKLEIWIKYYF